MRKVKSAVKKQTRAMRSVHDVNYHLVLIHTGGTISSVEDNSVRTLSRNAGSILNMFATKNNRFDEIFCMNIFSEYTNGDILNKLINCIKSSVKNSIYDAVIIFTGTDALPYTAATLSLVFVDIDYKIILVSSNHPLSSSNSNGMFNLNAAINFVEQDSETTGVFVSYKNTSDDFATIHDGSLLLEHRMYDDSLFSVDDAFVATVNAEGQIKYNENYTTPKRSSFDFKALSTHSPVLRIKAHPGMIYPSLEDGIKYVLYETYHSGTINTMDEQLIQFCDNCKAEDVKIFLVGVDSEITYESMKKYSELGLIVLPKTSPAAAYMRIWLLDSNDHDVLGILDNSRLSAAANCSLSGVGANVIENTL